MKLNNAVPWGSNLQEYRDMFMLSIDDLQNKTILSCGDGSASFNAEASKLNAKIVSIDPIYQFSAKDIEQRINDTSYIIANELKANREKFVWDSFKSPSELVDTRLKTMNIFLKDYENGKKKGRYIYQELPNLKFKDMSFDILLSSHFLFLYSKELDLDFHINSILKMCDIAKEEIKIFPILDLENRVSKHLKPILKILKEKKYKTEIVKCNYHLQKGANEYLSIRREN